MSNKNANQQGRKTKPGSVDEAAKALKNSQHSDQGEGQEGAKAEDQGGDGKPGDEEQVNGGAEGEPPSEPFPLELEQKVAEGEQPGSENCGQGEDQEGGGPVVQDLSGEVESDEMPQPVPDDAACEKFAKQLAKSPAHLDAFRKTIAMAEAIIEGQKPKPGVEEMAAINYQRLVDRYGKDFVTAQRGSNKSYFSRKAWNAMRNKRGWEEITKTMPEAAQASNTEK